MNFNKALEFFKRGDKIRRKSWDENKWINLNLGMYLSSGDLLADDWEVVGTKFIDALNSLLLEGKHIRRLSLPGDPVENQLYYTNNTLFKGLGTSSARKYRFTENDVNSSDWVVE